MERAHCIGQEYWTIRRTRCSCGFHYQTPPILQQLEHRNSGPVDVLVVRCAGCGNERAFEFDISSFFGKPDLAAFEEVATDKESVWRLYIKDQLPMETIIGYIRQLGEDKDRAALEYIADAARYFIARTELDGDTQEVPRRNA